MLIIPAENSVDWRKPPWVTLGLMLACVLVFLFYQGDDDRKMQAALEQYLETDLLVLEAPAYEDYLEREVRFEERQERLQDLQEFQSLRQDNEEVWQALTLLTDRDFYQYLQDNESLIWTPAERRYWLEHRSAVEQQWLSRISTYQLGLVPGELTPYTLITYQFLHGGWGHIIGNLVFLFLLGFTVEKALGPARYLVAYLLCGALSGLVFTAFSMGSHVPLVGASGSISGLMGMYVAIYGLQKIRFFVFLGVYFNYFRAPALAILPVWLGKEIYDYWFAGATGIAYMAHTGGLLAGAGLVAAFGKSWLQVRQEFFEPEEEEVDARFTSAYAQAMASIGRMEFDLARRQFQALYEQYPDRPILLDHLYQLAKLRPDQPAYRQRARERMSDALAHRQPEKMVQTWLEYLKEGEAHHPLAAGDHNRVLFASLKQQDMKTAEKAFERLRQTAGPEVTEEACRLLIAEFEKLQLGSKASHYRHMLQGTV